MKGTAMNTLGSMALRSGVLGFGHFFSFGGRHGGMFLGGLLGLVFLAACMAAVVLLVWQLSRK